MEQSKIETFEYSPDHPEILTVNMGPSHPATHGVLRVVLKLDGEPLAYNREDTLNPSFVGFGDADTDWLALVR